MFAFSAWFAKSRGPSIPTRLLQQRSREYLDKHTPSGWQEKSWAGEGWGVVVRHADLADWRWEFAEQHDGVHVLSLGFPIGLDPTTPLALGRRLLAGEDIHAQVTVPFALLAVDDRDGKFSVQQDWHGMGQVFRHESPRMVAFSSRPSMLPALLGEPMRPHIKGWSYYLGSGAFSGSSSPIRGVRLLHPGERLTGTRSADVWRVSTQRRRELDDIVSESLTEHASVEDIAAMLEEGVRRSIRSLAHYWPHGLRMSLSGGKDSRLLAALAIAEGHSPHFRTNEDNPVEGDTARQLSSILRERRGLECGHDFYVASPATDVLELDVARRPSRLQQHNDFMFRSSYLKRPPEDQPPASSRAPSMNGVFGEYVSGYWIPKPWKQDLSLATPERARRVVHNRVMSGAPSDALRPRARERLNAFIEGLLARGEELGLDPVGTISYGYMLGRIRRNNTSLTHPEQVMALAVPEIVKASMQLSPDDAAQERVHTLLINRLVPEWSGVPFVAARTGLAPDERLFIWDGSGAGDLTALLAGEPGPITSLMRRQEVTRALHRADAGTGTHREDRILRQFAMAAVAERSFQGPAAVEQSGTVARVARRVARGFRPVSRR